MSLACDMATSALIGRDESRDTGGGGSPPLSSATPSGLTASTPAAAAAGRSAWHCDVCGYSTMVARNLRIHLTSEKHAHNMAVLQQQQQQQQQSHQMRLLNAVASGFHHPSIRPPHVAWPAASAVFNSPLHPSTTTGVAVDLTRSGPAASPLTQRHQHHHHHQYHHHAHQLQQQNGRLSSSDAAVRSSPLYTCNLCPYSTALRANFHLHCQTDKHAQRVHQFALSVASNGTGGAGSAAVDDLPTSRSPPDGEQLTSDDTDRRNTGWR